MKKNKTLIGTLILFLSVTFRELIDGKLGIASLLLYGFIAILFITLFIIFWFKVVQIIKEKFKNKRTNITAIFLLLVLTLTIIFPGGIINFDKLRGKDVFVAYREGVAGCGALLQLKENLNYYQKGFCFGAHENNGKYSVNEDTIFFSNQIKFEFGLIRYYKTKKDHEIAQLEMYVNKLDSFPIPYSIQEDRITQKKEFYPW